MFCSQCGKKTRVIDTMRRHDKDTFGNWTWRLRKCPEGHTFETKELTLEPNELPTEIYRWQKKGETCHKVKARYAARLKR